MSSPTGSSNGNGIQPRPWWHIPENVQTITLKQACQQYHYSRNSILRKIYKQEIQGFKLGRRWYIVPGSLRTNTRVKKN